MLGGIWTAHTVIRTLYEKNFSIRIVIQQLPGFVDCALLRFKKKLYLGDANSGALEIKAFL